jgi:hypothetical protein
MTERTPQTEPPRGQLSTLAAALVLLVCLIGAAVALTFSGLDTARVIGLLSGIAGVGATMVGLLAKVSSLHQETAQQTETLTKIDHQTNGILAAKIKTAVAEALAEPIPYLPTEKDHP